MKLEKNRRAFPPVRPSFKTVFGILAVVVLCLSVPLSGLAQELSLEVIEQELKQIQRQILAAEEKAKADPRIAVKHEEIQKQMEAYLKFTEEFPPLKAAYKEMYDATDNLRKVTDERAKTFPAAMEQQLIIDAAGDRVRALRWDIVAAKMKFKHPDSPFNRMVDADPNYKALAAGEEPPEVDSPEVKAWMMKTPLPQVRQAILLAIPEAKNLSVQLKAWSNEISQVESDLIQSKTRLSSIKKNMQNGDDPEAQAAKERLDNSLNDVSSARNLPEFKAVAMKKRTDLVSLRDLVSEIAKEDPEVLALVQRRDILQKTKRTRAIEMSRKSRPAIPPK